MFVEWYQITSEFFRTLKQVLTCLFNRIKSHQKFLELQNKSEEIFRTSKQV